MESIFFYVPVGHVCIFFWKMFLFGYCANFLNWVLFFYIEYQIFDMSFFDIEYELYKKDLHDTDNHNGVYHSPRARHLESEVKWALGSITKNKASGGDAIPVELFQVIKDDAVKVLHSICQENSAVATGLEKVCFHSNPKGQSQRMFKLLYHRTHFTW